MVNSPSVIWRLLHVDHMVCTRMHLQYSLQCNGGWHCTGTVLARWHCTGKLALYCV